MEESYNVTTYEKNGFRVKIYRKILDPNVQTKDDIEKVKVLKKIINTYKLDNKEQK